MLQPGTPIGRFQIQRKLARGGMGTVYVAHDPVLGRMVAVKVFVGDMEVPDAAERFGREARAAASLNHTNIVTIFDFGEVGSQPYIVMEYIQGDTLTEIIRRRTAVPLAEKLRWLEELCAGAASAHRMDVVHRDIKPSNLMIDRTGRLKILDFGIAKIVNSLAKSVTAVIGTPGYMAPEQLLGKPVDARTDIFAIGVVCFELLTYEEAFQGDSFTAVTHRIINEDVRKLTDLVPEAPPELSEIIEKCLQKNPADRFKDAEALRIALSRIRRRIERSSDFDASIAQTIVSVKAANVKATAERQGAASLARKPSPVRGGPAELTPPPDPVTEQKTVARAQRAKIQGALQRSEACLQNGEFERALAASQEVLEIEPAHAGAIALQQRIKTAVARQQAAALLADARAEFQRGALTRCKSLLDEARHLDPATHDAALERDLRLARVEQERKRHRAETISRTVAVARAALDREDFEAALGLAREALSLDQNCEEARDIELVALRALEQGDGGVPTVVGPPDTGSQDAAEPPLPPLAPRAIEHTLDDETTVVALPWRGATPTATPPVPAAHDLPPLPPLMPPPTAPRPTPAPTRPAASALGATPPPGMAVPPPPVTSPPRAVPATAPAPVVPSSADPGRSGAVSAARTSSGPVVVVSADGPPGVPTAAPPAPSVPRPLAGAVTRAPGLPVGAWIDGFRSTLSRVAARVRALPRTQLLVIAGIVSLVILGVAVAALVSLRPGPVPQGVVVIEAVPWANVTAIRSADGTNRLAAPAATPLSMPLPAGTYTVELSSPSTPADTQTLTVNVTADQVIVAPAARFLPLTSDEYFNEHLGVERTPASTNPDGAATTPGAPAVSPAGDAAATGSQPPPTRGATP